MSQQEPQFNEGLMVLVLTGFKQSGKDYLTSRIAHALKGKRKVVRLSFSDELRVISNYIFPWLPLAPDNEVKDRPYIHPKNKTDASPRQIWKMVADDKTGICAIQDDVLVDHFERNQLSEATDPAVLYIVTDLRKVAEDLLVERNGFKKIRILNPDSQRPMKEDDVEYNIPLFRVDGELMNERDEESVGEFFNMVAGLYPILKEELSDE
ncbi:MAG: hypothetical protein ACRCTP_04430 [Aeromonas popoffii]|uniref:hypothetical protein n=1 Tax=Aeromonas popoffii TaxID=70856 RepID=UPI003F372CE7